LRRNTHRYFAYQLAERLGRANVDALLRSLTAKQFREWEEYARLRPWEDTDRRADWRAALVTKQIFDSNQRLVDVVLAAAGVAKHKRPRFVELELKDFLLQWESDEDASKPRRKQTWQEQWKIVERINSIFALQES